MHMEQVSSFVTGKIRKILRNSALRALLLALVIVAIACAAHANFSLLIRPVQLLGDASRVKNSQFKQGAIVNLKAGQVIDTGIYYYGESKGKVGAIATSDGYLLIDIPDSNTSLIGKKNVRITALVDAISTDRSSKVNELVSYIAKDEQLTAIQQRQLRAAFADVQLRQGNSWIGTLVAVWIAALAAVLLLVYAISRLILLGAPERSRVYRRLVTKGSGDSIAGLATKLDEAGANGTITRIGKSLYFSPEVVGAFLGWTGQLHPVKDLIWVYPHVTRQRVNGIPAGATWSVDLCFADGRKVRMGVRKEAQAKDRIQEILSLCPTVLSGYSADRQAKFSKGNMDALRQEQQARTSRPGPTATQPVAPPLESAGDPASTSATSRAAKQAPSAPQAAYVAPNYARKQARAAKKAAKRARKRGEFDASDVSAPPAGMQASAPKEATAPAEEMSFGLHDDEFGHDFK